MIRNINDERFIRLKKHFDEVSGNGEEVALAVEDLYSIYDEELCRWLARLYDPEIGGFYYSNSARDNNGFLPDVESTVQALNIVGNSGMFENPMDLPERMREQIKGFVCSLLDPLDGYIYHPQWGKGITDSRRGRDLNWAVDIARRFGFSLPYPTANERLKALKSSCMEEDKSRAAALLPEHLLSKEAFLKYREGFDWVKDAYYAGNTIAAQGSQIIAAGLADVAAEYINRFQNPENGFWHKETNMHYGVNGFLKITAFYNQAGIPINMAETAAESTIQCLTSDEIGTTPCHLFNCWFNIMNIRESLKRTGEEEALSRITRKLYETAPITIRGTKKKQEVFKKEGGGFSYTREYSCATSQGAPAAVPKTRESDVNASVLCTTGSVVRMFMALGAADVKIPLYGKEDRHLFLDNLRLD